MDDFIFEIRINRVSTTGNSATENVIPPPSPAQATGNVIPTPSPAQASPNVISTSTADFFSTSAFFPRPPAPPLMPQSSPRPSTSANQPSSEVPRPLWSSSRSNASVMPPPTTSRASVDVSPSPNHPPFSSPPEGTGSNDLSNPMYFGNHLRLHSNTALDAARSHFENNVFGRLYADYKKTTPNNENEKNIQDNVLKGLKYLISDRDALIHNSRQGEEAYASLMQQQESLTIKLQKSESTTDGLKKLLENAEKKAAKSAEDQKNAEEECKRLKGQLKASEVHSEVQRKNLDNYKNKNDKLSADIATLKKEVDELKSSHARMVQELQDKLKAEQDAAAALKNELKEAEQNAEKESAEYKKYRAQKKATDTENNRIKQEMDEMKKEIQDKDTLISNFERDQKMLTTANRELTRQKNEAEERVKQLEEQNNALKKENKDAKAAGKSEGKAEAEAAMKPKSDKFNQQTEALKLLMRDLNSIQKLSRKRKIRQQPAAVSHTVSNSGPSAAKKRRVENDVSPTNARSRSIPLTATIQSEPNPPVQQQPLRINSSGPSGVGTAGDGTLFANNRINNLMQQMGGAPAQSLPDTSVPPPPITVPLPNMSVPPPLINVPPPSFVNRQPNANVIQVLNPGYRPPTFMNQQNEPRMMPQHFVPQRPHIPTPQQTLIQHNPDYLQRLEKDATRLLQQTYDATPVNARTCFFKLDRMSQDLLREYSLYLMQTTSAITNSHPIMQMLIDDNRQQQFAQQYPIQQHQQLRPPIPQVQQQQQQLRPSIPQVQQQQQRPVYERVQTAHRSSNPGAFSNRRKNKTGAAPAQTVPSQVPYTTPIQPQQQQQQQRFVIPPQQSLSAGFQPQRPQSHQPSAQPSQPQRTPAAQNPERNRTPVSAPAPASATSTPHLSQALNSRPSNPTARGGSDVSIPTLLEMCQPPRRREVNGGNILRNFNVPFGDEVCYSDANILDQSFRASSRRFAR